MPPTMANNSGANVGGPISQLYRANLNPPGRCAIPRRWRYWPCRELATTSADASGSAVLAIRFETTPPAAAIDTSGVASTGSHIIRLPKLARSCSSQISVPVTAAPIAVRPHSARSNRPCSTFWMNRSTPTISPDVCTLLLGGAVSARGRRGRRGATRRRKSGNRSGLAQCVAHAVHHRHGRACDHVRDGAGAGVGVGVGGRRLLSQLEGARHLAQVLL